MECVRLQMPWDIPLREMVGMKNRVLSAAGRAGIAKAARKRWAKVKKLGRK